MLRSDFFKGMLPLPVSTLPLSLNETAVNCIAKAKAQGLDGTSDATAVDLPSMFTTAEIEKFLEFIFFARLSHFFAVDTGINFARHHLDDHEGLDGFSRLKLGFDYHIKAWIAKAFDELMATPITDITAEQEQLMGWAAYRALARAQAKVLDYRMTLAVKPPIPSHCNWCSNHLLCATDWNQMWTSVSGVLGALIQDEKAGAEILELLPTGRVNRCDGLKGTAEGLSILKQKEDLIDAVVAELIKQQGIA
ncbi:hypothetical protein K438DRAFT_1772397 [Mycena galopus ATCC 62051]|nr:hypothetical protein K438DRAFT_1772397 [Mycena galopus ATCC 62051]